MDLQVRVEICSPLDLSLAEFAQCANRSFPNRDETAEHLQWKWRFNGFGDSQAVVARARTGELLGAIVLGQQALATAGETVLGYCIYDLFVTPEARGRGVYTELLKMVPHVLGETQVLFSFPNQGAMPGQLRNGWRCIRRVRQYSALRSVRLHGMQDVSDDECKIAELCTGSTFRKGVSWQPNEQHVAWRLQNPKRRTYLLQESSVLALVSVADRLGRRELRTLMVTDLVAGPIHQRLRALRRMAASLNCSFATTAESCGAILSAPRAALASWFPRPSNVMLTTYIGQKPVMDEPWTIEGGMIHTW